ncbi:FKBP-type peptidyl-prolyl cis-trans isomerase [Candidatus Peregrinibacteria bacterium]|jgi:FKBP-type peptidyl-prolyl cis-trans isomerase|nr:FKBP-type peptidyl-prolyl cis-trans isomerase [Candidatus Peregrinibacteria bacterium]MBT4631993.1 FKBP-type peptidyl-prolyl cis-trans isomerase [Candidatus Peregrinibacteria bacterium]MBT5516415.1 FKBP-type peptidyl-prolyl cis-trans isomerase [Candidatus Peregrinibacteria bacterium]MBT5823804.1 FKBP-type peptidyl-prolyl cis-trans isomerase [Candidatus Peregrinibacteria bacterium]
MKYLLATLTISALLMSACTSTNPEEMPDENTAAQAVTELVIDDLKVGDGDEAVSGKTVEVHYVGTLLDGSQFDSSRDRGQTFEFPLGAGYVIKGWDEGVAGMKVGGLRKLTIPADMAYGDRATGSIPANSTLVFEVELFSVK